MSLNFLRYDINNIFKGHANKKTIKKPPISNQFIFYVFWA